MAKVQEAALATLFRPSTVFLKGDGRLPIFWLMGITVILPFMQMCPAVDLHDNNNSVQPIGSGIEVVSKALGVLGVKVSVSHDNTSIDPAPVIDGGRNTFSKKSSHITLSHIFGAKEFFRSFPPQNFTSLHPTHAGHPTHDTRNVTREETQTQNTAERIPDVSAEEGSQLSDHESPGGGGGGGDKNASGTDAQDQRDDDTQGKGETGPLETVKDSVGSPVEGKGEEQTPPPPPPPQEEMQEAKEHTQTETTISRPSDVADTTETETQVPPPEIGKSGGTPEDEVTQSKETQAPSKAAKSEEPETSEPTVPPTVESNHTSGGGGGGEEEAGIINVESVEVVTDESADQQSKVKKKENVNTTACDHEGDKDRVAADTETTEDLTKKKKKTGDREREKTADTLETYSQFTQRVNAEKKNGIAGNGHGMNGHGKGPKVKSKNYASPDCGSKLMSANPEATHSSKVIHSNKDEYLLNKCGDKTWFVIELCESIRPQKFDIANFELFSNLPKDIHVLGSHRYPSREWTPLAWARGEEGNRDVQSFPIKTDNFFKYIKVEVHSHYGPEYFCPISLFRIYGLSEFEVMETEDQEYTDETETSSESQSDEKKVKDEDDKPSVTSVIKNMFSGVLDVIKRGYRPHTSSTESGDSCYTLESTHSVDKKSCQLAVSLNYILSCYNAEYQLLMQKSFVSHTIRNFEFCRLLASTMCLTPDVSDSVVYDTVCNSSYLCIMLSPKHMLAMCFMHDSRIMNFEVACQSTGGTPLLPDNFSTTTPPVLPAESRMPSYVKNAKSNTSTVTRSDATIPNKSGSLTGTNESWKSDKEEVPEQVSLEQVTLQTPEEPAAPTPSDEGGLSDAAKPKKPKASGGSQEQVVVVAAAAAAKQSGNATETQESEQQVEGSVNTEGGEHLTEKGSVKVVEDVKQGERLEDELPSPVTPLAGVVEPKVPSTTSPTNKESVVVRLSNKIKALEYNMSLSSQYLEELSRWYKSQMEEMQHQFNLTVAALNATSHQAFERDQHHQRDIKMLEEQLASVNTILRKLVEERESLAHTVVEQHLLLMVVEVVVLCVVFVLCHKRTTQNRLLELEMQERRTQTPSEDPLDKQEVGGSGCGNEGWTRGRVRRRSVDSITRERTSRQRRNRRPSEEALRISGTYEDLLIIEPAIPIMVDSVSDRKKKRKSSSGVLKRSKSNASIVEKAVTSTRESQRMENLDMSSAGVLFWGDQVDSKGPCTHLTNDSVDSCFTGDPNEAPVINGSVFSNSRSYIEEISHLHNNNNNNNNLTIGTSKRYSVNCSQNSDEYNRHTGKLTKSHSVNSEKLRNGTEKKKKKLKKKISIQESEQQHHHHHHHEVRFHESEVCCDVNKTLYYNGHSEHNHHQAEYYYNGHSSGGGGGGGGNSVHFSETLSSSSGGGGGVGSNYNMLGNTNGCTTTTTNYVNGDSSHDQSYVGSEYTYSGHGTNYSEKRRTSGNKVKLRSDNWEWYSSQQQQQQQQQLGSSCSETVSTCSDSSGKTRRGRHEEVSQTVEQIDDKKVKKKRKGKSRSAVVVLEEETNNGT